MRLRAAIAFKLIQLKHWARSGLAAVRRVKFEARPESSRSRNADASTFSAAWTDNWPFGFWKPLLIERRRNDGTELEVDTQGAFRLTPKSDAQPSR
jgi:hypothetical protein